MGGRRQTGGGSNGGLKKKEENMSEAELRWREIVYPAAQVRVTCLSLSASATPLMSL